MRTWILGSKLFCLKSSTIQASRLIIIKTKLIVNGCNTCCTKYTPRHATVATAITCTIQHLQENTISGGPSSLKLSTDIRVQSVSTVTPDGRGGSRGEGSLAANGRSRMRPGNRTASCSGTRGGTCCTVEKVIRRGLQTIANSECIKLIFYLKARSHRAWKLMRDRK